MRGLALFLLLTGPASAETLATLSSSNGSLPPTYQRSQTVVIDSDGAVLVRACESYGATCKAFQGTTAPEAVAAILAAVEAAGLVARPIAEDPTPPVGGSTFSGAVMLDGAILALPAFPVEADRARKDAVVVAIYAAVPGDLAPAAGADVTE